MPASLKYLIVAEEGEHTHVLHVPTDMAAQRVAGLLATHPKINAVEVYRVSPGVSVPRPNSPQREEVTAGLPQA